MGSPQPTPGSAGRIGAGFAATPDGTHAVLYGGGDVFNGGTALGDTWVWDGASWTAKCATTVCGPGRRLLVGAATSPTGVVLYGGQSKDVQGSRTVHHDMWRWNGSTWNQVCASCPPGVRAGMAMAGNGTTVLLFGGGTLGNTNMSFGDTWQLVGNVWSPVNGGGAGQPAPRIGASMAWDGEHFVLFGGLTPTSGNGNDFALADTWIWSRTKWVQQCGTPLPACPPTGRLLGGFANLANPDPTRRGALLVGGLSFPQGTNGNPAVRGDTWFWNRVRWRKEASPWADSSPVGDGGPPSGVPSVGALAALPASCQLTLAGDFPIGAASRPVIRSGTWDIGFDANGDHHPDVCPASVPSPTTTAMPPPTTVPHAALLPSPTVAPIELPNTGTNATVEFLAAVAGVASGAIFAECGQTLAPACTGLSG